MLLNVMLSFTVSLLLTCFYVFVIRPAWHAWDHTE